MTLIVNLLNIFSIIYCVEFISQLLLVAHFFSNSGRDSRDARQIGRGQHSVVSQVSLFLSVVFM